MNVHVRLYIVTLPNGETIPIESGGNRHELKGEVAAMYGYTTTRHITITEIQ